MDSWTFLTNHAHVLLCLSVDPGMRLRDVAEKVGITERAAQRIVADLIAAGYVSSTREGRRNQYEIHSHLPLRHPIEKGSEVSALLSLVKPELVTKPYAHAPGSRPVAHNGVIEAGKRNGSAKMAVGHGKKNGSANGANGYENGSAPTLRNGKLSRH